MDIKRTIKSLVIFIVVGVLSGCNDKLDAGFEIVSVKKIGSPKIADVIGNDASLPLIEYWNSVDFLVLTLRSTKNLVSYIKKKSASLYVEGSFCERPNTSVLLTIPSLYHQSADIISLKLFDEEKIKPDSNGWFYYNIVIFSSWDKEREIPAAFRKPNDNTNYASFSLESQAQDICIEIRGGNMVTTYQFETIILSKSQIEDAMGWRDGMVRPSRTP